MSDGAPSSPNESRATRRLPAVGRRDGRLRAVAVALLLGVAGWFVGAAATLLFGGHLAVLGIDSPIASEIATSVAFNLLGTLGLSIAYLVFRYGEVDLGRFRSYLRISRPTRWDLGWIVLGVVGAFAVVVAFTAAMEILDPFGTGGQGETHSGIEDGREFPPLLLLGVPIAILLTGPGEELLFRGLVQSRLVEAYPAPVAVLLSSLVFGAVHVPVYLGDALGPTLVSLGTVTALGLYLGILYELSGNLFVPAVVHGGFNAVVSLSNYVSV